MQAHQHLVTGKTEANIPEKGFNMETNDMARTDYERAVAKRQSEWLEKAFLQIEFTAEALEAIDRSIGLSEGDTLVCETTCLGYAAHAMEMGVAGLLLVPPQMDSGSPSPEMLGAFRTVLEESFGGQLDSLAERGTAFGGITTSVPEWPFRMLVTTHHVTDDQPATEWPLYNGYWVDMLNTEGATGAVIFPPDDEEDGEPPYISAPRVGGVHDTGRFAGAVELPGGYVALYTYSPSGTTGLEEFEGLGIDPFVASMLTVSFRMEDLSAPGDPWACEATALTLLANGGCLVPSLVRSGVEVVDETTLGELASRISRGTTLTEKGLSIKGRLSERARRAAEEAEADAWATLDPATGFNPEALMRAQRLKSDIWASAREDDLYYVDGSCFADGEISPALLRSMPKGQERYVVNSYDGKVLLVSRNSKEAIVYSARRPTLIGNSVFVVRLDSDISRDYLACWMRGLYAQEWMHNSGKYLTKRILECLPVPILGEEAMAQTLDHERSIDRKILELKAAIQHLESSDRFNPSAAAWEAKEQ